MIFGCIRFFHACVYTSTPSSPTQPPTRILKVGCCSSRYDFEGTELEECLDLENGKWTPQFSSVSRQHRGYILMPVRAQTLGQESCWHRVAKSTGTIKRAVNKKDYIWRYLAPEDKTIVKSSKSNRYTTYSTTPSLSIYNGISQILHVRPSGRRSGSPEHDTALHALR